jgi:hypothetical protein
LLAVAEAAVEVVVQVAEVEAVARVRAADFRPRQRLHPGRRRLQRGPPLQVRLGRVPPVL